MPLVDPNNKNTQQSEMNVDNTARQPQPNPVGRAITYLSFILIIPIFIFIGARNNLVKMQIKLNESISGIDIQLAKRKDTLTKLVDATKGSMKFEKELLTEVTKMRKQTISAGNRSAADASQTMVAGRLMATLEAYPEIKSTKSVEKIIDAAETIEQEIAATRRLYNSYVNQYNASLFTWPGSVIAGDMKLTTFPMFKATTSQREDVKVEF